MDLFSLLNHVLILTCCSDVKKCDLTLTLTLTLSQLTHKIESSLCKSVSGRVCHTQFVEYAINMCCHMEKRSIIISIISVISLSPHVQEKKSSGKAGKANIKLCIIAPMALNPEKGEYDIT